jgi:hypothetical protein
MSKHQRGKKGLTSPCKQCRRRVRPELLDGSYLCAECRGDPAAMWLKAVRKTRRARRK